MGLGQKSVNHKERTERRAATKLAGILRQENSIQENDAGTEERELRKLLGGKHEIHERQKGPHAKAATGAKVQKLMGTTKYQARQSGNRTEGRVYRKGAKIAEKRREHQAHEGTNKHKRRSP